MCLLSLVWLFAALPVCAAQPGAAGPQRPRPTATSERFDSLAKKADSAREARRLEEAIGLYRQAIQLRRKWVEGHWAPPTCACGLLLPFRAETAPPARYLPRALWYKPPTGPAVPQPPSSERP